MENFSAEVPPLGEKDDHQMITLVESTDMDDNNALNNRASPPLVHVLEAAPFGSMPSTTATLDSSPQCLICNAKLGVSGRGSMDIFSKQVKTTSRHLDLDVAVGSIINRDLSPSEVQSTIICKKCFRLVDDIDCLEGQLLNMKREVTNKYTRTLTLLKHESNGIFIDDNYDPEGITATSKDDEEYRIYSTRKARQKRRRRGRGKPPSYLELEVKEEVVEHDLEETMALSDPSQMLPQDTLRSNNAEDTQDFLVQFNYESENNDLNDDSDFILVDGLDLQRDEATIQFGGIILDPLADDDVKPTSGLNQAASTSNEGKFKCRYCQLKLGYFTDVEKHLLEFHTDRLNECEVCGKQLMARSDLLEHLQEHIASGETPYTCYVCHNCYALPRQLREHLWQNGGKTCYRCSKRFCSEAALTEHMNSHTNNRPYACEKCNKKFTSKHILKTHMKTHGVRARPHKCKVCQKHFLTAFHLQDHVQIHQNRKDFICVSCGKAFSTQRGLDLHSLIHSGIKNYACRICHKAFARKGEVEDHERIHTGERPFQCEICGATFSQRSNLLSHKKAIHYEEKRYQCNECPKAFKRRRLLVYHVMSIHTGERPFKCEICSAAFVYPEHYKKHLRIHTGEKPFKCEICGKAFNSRDNKNSHKFIHSDKKQYECLLCGAGFMRKPLLANHMAQHQQSGNIENMEDYVKVNPPTVVDAELLENTLLTSPSVTMKIDDEVELVRADQIESDDVEIMARPIHLMDSDDMPKYIIHTGDKGDESVGHFLASLQGQVVEVRAEDLEHYTELTPDQITQMAQVAAQVVASQSTTQNSDRVQSETFHIQVEEEKEKSILSHGTIAVSGEQTILQLGHRENSSTVLEGKHPGQFVQTFKKVQISNPRTIRQIRSFNQTAEFENNT